MSHEKLPSSTVMRSNAVRNVQSNQETLITTVEILLLDCSKKLRLFIADFISGSAS